MTCNEFNERIADLFDKDIDPLVQGAMEQHMAQCSKCRTCYEELRSVYTMLQPSAKTLQSLKSIDTKIATATAKTSPIVAAKQRVGIRKSESEAAIPLATTAYPTRRKRIWWAVAASFVFCLGVFVGIGKFFSANATAAPQSPTALFDHSIVSLQRAGSFRINVYARTRPQENFYSLFLGEDFVKAELNLMRKGDSVFYRIEREGEYARVLMYDGKNQYMWTGNDTPVKGPLDYNFLGIYKNLLYPDRLLMMQKSAIDLSKKDNVLRSETDSTITIITEGTEWDNDLQVLYDTGYKAKNKVTIENIFSKPDGLLRSVRYWIHKNGYKLLALYTGSIQYNPQLSKESITAMPQYDSVKKIILDIEASPSVSTGRMEFLQNESSVDAAKRIMASLSSGHTGNIKEAFYSSEDDLPDLIKLFKDCQFSDFTKRISEDYAGEYVYFMIQYPDGEKKLCHISLRNDNEQHIWIFDGGL